MLCFQQLTQLNLVITVEKTPTRANSFNLSDPAVVVNERAVTSRHSNDGDSNNPHPVAVYSVQAVPVGVVGVEALVADVPGEVELVVVLLRPHVCDRDANSFAVRHPGIVW